MKIYSIMDALSLSRAFADFHDHLSVHGIGENCLFDCKLVFSELASNAVKHADGGTIRVHVTDGEIVITLLGEFVAPEKSVCSPVLEESGRGLYLIDSVCKSRTNTAEGLQVVLIKR